MIGQPMAQAMNQQINAELYSAYLYLAMAAYCESLQLAGFAHWFKVQAQEEMTHALRFSSQLSERGGRPTLGAIKAPPASWNSPLACMQEVAAHEAKVTALINDLVALARQEKDYASENFLQWFVAEQVEEEANVAQVVGALKLVGDQGNALFMLDKEMGARVFTMPLDLKL